MKKQMNARAILAANVRRFREGMELSQEALAGVAGFHRTYVSQVELERSNITIDNLERLAKTFGLSVSQLLADSDAGTGTR